MVGGEKVEVDECTRMALLTSSLCNNSTISQNPEGHWVGVGTPTEVLTFAAYSETVADVVTQVALQVLAAKADLGKPQLLSSGEWKMLIEYPFDSASKTMIAVFDCKADGYTYAFLKGVFVPVSDLVLMTGYRSAREGCCGMRRCSDWRRVLFVSGEFLGSTQGAHGCTVIHRL